MSSELLILMQVNLIWYYIISQGVFILFCKIRLLYPQPNDSKSQQRLNIWVNECLDNIKTLSVSPIHICSIQLIFVCYCYPAMTLCRWQDVKTQLLLATRFGVLRYYILYKYKHTKVAYIDSNTGSYSITGHAMRGIFPHRVTNLVHVWHSDKPPSLQPVEDVTGETRQRIHHDSDLDFYSWFMECA